MRFSPVEQFEVPAWTLFLGNSDFCVFPVGLLLVTCNGLLRRWTLSWINLACIVTVLTPRAAVSVLPNKLANLPLIIKEVQLHSAWPENHVTDTCASIIIRHTPLKKFGILYLLQSSSIKWVRLPDLVLVFRPYLYNLPVIIDNLA
jgi:hypothetical protein